MEPSDTDGSALLSGMHSGAYGAGFAEVYDHWYGDDDAEEMVELLASLADTGDVLELGVGTGRLAIPLAARIAPHTMVGLDSSPEMLQQLTVKDPDHTVVTVLADMGDMDAALPDGPFSLVYASHNTLLNLATLGEQGDCMAAVAARLTVGGRFLIDALVPPTDAESVEEVRVRSMSVDQVVLSVARFDADQRVATGQFIDFGDGIAPRLRPWLVRYSTVAELDEIASAAGLDVECRWSDARRSAYTDRSRRHLTVYQRRANADD